MRRAVGITFEGDRGQLRQRIQLRRARTIATGKRLPGSGSRRARSARRRHHHLLDTQTVRPLRETAIATHASQIPPYAHMPEDLVAEFLTCDRLVRTQPPWNGGPPERSLGLKAAGCPAHPRSDIQP